MKKLIVLFLLVPTLLFSYEYVIPYGDTPFPVSSGSTLSVQEVAPVEVTTANGDRVVTLQNDTYLIQQGNMWSFEATFSTLADATTYYLVFDARSMTKALRSFPTEWGTSNSYVDISLGTATGFTGGTEILAGNIFNRKAGADSREVEIYWNPSAIAGGSFPAYPNLFVGTEGTPQNAGGGQQEGRFPIILDNDTLYIFRIVVPTGDDIVRFRSHITWTEVAQ